MKGATRKKPTGKGANKDKILDTARALFCKRGFHGTSIRDIAKEAGVSLGNLYNHYAGKEELFAALLERYEAEYFNPGNPLPKAFLEAPFPANIEAIGKASGETIRRFSDYILLIYVDVVEFQGRYIGTLFRGMRERYRAHLEATGGAAAAGMTPGVDPAAAMMMVTLSFFNYFIVERLFGVRKHFGLSDQEVIELFARVYRFGLTERK
ncbi:MAG: hypothetical protein AUJ52_10555 [Elusimicrobia bacterium CG1_02_63_36]|nr:MAG: hypothetical protein AUJ52_10555 [Elusimicrobia bacterium CG1_02_63_36]PIP85152.1 MAG: hypothetical protein COR54_00390 [Elusimicrobia bacterium CG22_combo_CG10-13_8_21_14_all_63_91]